MIRAAAALALLALLPGAATDPLTGRVAGTPQRCVSYGAQSASLTVAGDGRSLLYREGSRRLWRMEPIGQCARLRPFDTVIVEVFGAQLCRNDRFRTLTPGMTIPSAACRVGMFVPYDAPAR